MKILVVPDTHGRKFWRQAIEENIENVDKVIFLGDYLDPYPEEIQMTPELMECTSFDDAGNLLCMLDNIISLKKNEPDKYILLTGNHSDNYIWKSFNRASRTDIYNYNLYHNFFLENLNLFNLVYIDGNTIFSHAGISKEFANVLGFSSIRKAAEYLSKLDLTTIDNKIVDYLGYISSYRYGSDRCGSCEWADIREHIDKITNYQTNEFIGKGEEGVFQVFGHTQLKAPLICKEWACLDCRKSFIVDDGKVCL